MQNSEGIKKGDIKNYALAYEQFRDIVEKSPVGIIITNKEGVICYANPVANDLFGINDEMLLGTPFGMPLTHGTVAEIDIRQSDGSVGIAEMREVETVWNGEKAFLVLIQDVTENRKINEQLRKLSKAVEQSMSSIVITDINGNIQYANPKFAEITGYTASEIMGQNPRFLKSGKTTPEEYKTLWDTITIGNCWQGEFYNKKKNGEYYWELAQISPIKSKEGEITGFLGIKEDITEMKRAASIQEELREQLFHAQKLESVGRLAGGVAHDFNNILMAIIGYTNLVEIALEDNTPAKEYLHKVLTLAERAADLTRSILAFSRKQVIVTQPLELNTIVQGARVLTDRLLREEIQCNVLLSDKKLVVKADKNRLEQVIMNLVTNAIDAMPDGGEITIKTDSEIIDDDFIKIHGFGEKGEYALLSITDTGIGIDYDIRKKIFEPFFTTKDVGKGTGLGLSIVYGIVKQHNGFVDVHSEFGEGAAFFIYLPLANDLPGKPADSDTGPDSFSAVSAGRILIAEDDESVRFLMKEVLGKFGYEVIAAVNGADAVEKFKENKDVVCLLILDVKMPVMNGKDAYDEIKKIAPEVKAIFLSGYSENIIDQSMFTGESVSFLQKPVLPSRLVKKIHEMVAK
ncbi:MAG: PAS domain S-box protein [Candidatus Kuenenia sp.]|nr:PAS domain S-box protein [Candidatus Kuenenia hertensis]